ncbi:MAG TPA: RagB/SusD family nutrient uptake outer membrane protein [Gemmatimonadales bacterium]|nr:RagB/SusD family nutrient uptake outer membrane protein [Gemmatimonadales bacterium]
MKRRLVTASIGTAGLFGLLLVPLQGCTNLDETPPSQIAAGNFYSNEAEVLAGLAGVYAVLRSTSPEGALYDANEVSTDEIVVPTRGSDWYDNGQWIDLHNHTWTPTSAASGFFNGAWNTAFGGVASANLFLSRVQNSTFPNKASIVAEGRGLRAFYYYLLLDMFGGVPIVTTTDIAQRPRSTRRALFNFIESELIAARDSGLPATWDAGDNGRFTKGAADAILANMYLNAGVFTKDAAGAGGINASAYNSCSGVTVSGNLDACLAADSAATRLINSPNYRLADSFPQNFRADNNLSPENIFAVKFIHADGLGLDLTMAALHYCQYHPLTPWNGFATLAQTFNSFDSAGVGGATKTDKRRHAILFGPQFDVLSGAPATVRVSGSCPATWTPQTALVFTDSIRNIRSATEGEGPRIYKWPADPSHVQQNSGNDYAWFRLGEMYLIKAEVENELGNTATALTLLNTLRARGGRATSDTVAAPLVVVNRSVILNERLFELFGENKRRQDLVRFGQYTGRTDAASGLAGGKVASPDYYVLFPIPQTQIDANAQLKQNPGY